jgi:hypothetical protein
LAGDEVDLVAEREPVGGGRDREAAVLVGGALVGAAGSSQTNGGPESKVSALRPASMIARSSAGRLITVARIARQEIAGPPGLVDCPSTIGSLLNLGTITHLVGRPDT